MSGRSRLSSASSIRDLKRLPLLRVLERPAAYAVGSTLASLLSLGTSFVAPSLLGPAAFGSFALLTSLFQYASKFDMGLSQLADRDLAAGRDASSDRASDILRANWAAGILVLALFLPLAVLVGYTTRALSPLDAAITMAGGAMFLIANAPVTLFRARSQIWAFTATALLLQLGMTFPRLAGLVLGGVTGCFAALLLWYGGLALLLAKPASVRRMRISSVIPIWREGAPLFVFNLAWLLYLTANRWVSAGLSSADDLGMFAFGANLAFLAVGILSTVAQVRYPKLLSQISQAPHGAASRAIEREVLSLTGLIGAGALASVFLAGPAIAFVFPGYEHAVRPTIALAVSCISLGAAAWIVPMVIALSHRPVTHALTLFAPAFAVLIMGMISGDRIGGILGQAWACAASALFLMVAIIGLLRVMGLLTTSAAFRTAGAQVFMVLILSLTAYSFGPRPVMGIMKTFAAGASDSALEPGWELAFDENFSRLDLWDGKASGRWEPHYPWGNRTNADNGELQYYVDPRKGWDAASDTLGTPYAIRDGGLVIRASPIVDPSISSKLRLQYASGLLTTARSFKFRYGYVEMRARVPKGKGLWPAFWLAPGDQSWPPEIDILESLGHDMNQYFITIHSSVNGVQTRAQGQVDTSDLSQRFHTYGVKWTPQEIVWYFDGRPVARTPTPADMHKPMYMIVNLAVGGHWPGAPDQTTEFPAEFVVDRIRAYIPRDSQL
jgi:O-antigen/teichoic acid export membrane protein